MHRVVTKRLDHRNNWIVEAGPWHVSLSDAENWAAILRHLGYNAHVEGLHGALYGAHADDDLMDALSSMA